MKLKIEQQRLVHNFTKFFSVFQKLNKNRKKGNDKVEKIFREIKVFGNCCFDEIFVKFQFDFSENIKQLFDNK